jgi:hypothetical protein
MHLELEGELREMVNLGENIQWEIGLPESNLVSLVQEGIYEFSLRLYNQIIFFSQRYPI